MNDGFAKDQGVFSLSDNSWIEEPVNQEINLDNPHISKKVQEYIEKILTWFWIVNKYASKKCSKNITI
jgi:hypothetical protein